MWQVHTGAYVSLLSPGKTDFTYTVMQQQEQQQQQQQQQQQIEKYTPAVRSKILSKLQVVCDAPIARNTGCVSSLD